MHCGANLKVIVITNFPISTTALHSNFSYKRYKEVLFYFPLICGFHFSGTGDGDKGDPGEQGPKGEKGESAPLPSGPISKQKELFTSSHRMLRGF